MLIDCVEMGLGWQPRALTKQDQPRWTAYAVSQVSLYTMNLIPTHKASGHGQRRSPGFGVTLVSVKWWAA